MLSSILTFLCFASTTVVMHLLTKKEITGAKQTTLAGEAFLHIFWLGFTLASIHYLIFRLNLELFIANYKNMKEKTQLEEIIELMPDSVMIVGSQKEKNPSSENFLQNDNDS